MPRIKATITTTASAEGSQPQILLKSRDRSQESEITQAPVTWGKL